MKLKKELSMLLRFKSEEDYVNSYARDIEYIKTVNYIKTLVEFFHIGGLEKMDFFKLNNLREELSYVIENIIDGDLDEKIKKSQRKIQGKIK